MWIPRGKSTIPELICRTYHGIMKKSILTPAVLCAILVSSACPSFRAIPGQHTRSVAESKRLAAIHGTELLGRQQSEEPLNSCATTNPEQPADEWRQVERRRWFTLGALMGPAMMASTMVMGRGMRGMGRGYRPHLQKQQKDDDEQKEKIAKEKTI